jgi:hypothetical protein
MRSSLARFAILFMVDLNALITLLRKIPGYIVKLAGVPYVKWLQPNNVNFGTSTVREQGSR